MKCDLSVFLVLMEMLLVSGPILLMEVRCACRRSHVVNGGEVCLYLDPCG